MKTLNKRLRLAKETVRVLTVVEMRSVRSGLDSVLCVTQPVNQPATQPVNQTAGVLGPAVGMLGIASDSCDVF